MDRIVCVWKWEVAIIERERENGEEERMEKKRGENEERWGGGGAERGDGERDKTWQLKLIHRSVPLFNGQYQYSATSVDPGPGQQPDI